MSTFWVRFYPDASVLEDALSVEAEAVKSLYFSFLQSTVPKAVQNAPVFQEDFWSLVELIYEPTSFEVVVRKGETYYKYPLDSSYAHIPQLYNVILDPTIRLRENVDYLIERTLNNPQGDNVKPVVTSHILFKNDPYLNNDVPKRLNASNKLSMVFYAPKTFIDNMDLFENYGSLFNSVAVSSEEYKAFLTGLTYIYTNGPSIGALNAGLSLSAGYPVARQEDVIVSVLVEDHLFTLLSQKGDTYEIPRKVVNVFNESTQQEDVLVYPTLKVSNLPYADIDGINHVSVNFQSPLLAMGTYPTFYPVSSFDTFITDIRIEDWQTDRYWWRKQISKISSALVPDLPEDLRKHPMVRDYLFENYFKDHTFGVFIDYRAFREDFQKIPDFMQILRTVKPTYTTFVVEEFDLRVFTLVRMNPSMTTHLQSFVSPVPTTSTVLDNQGNIISGPPRNTVIPTPIIDPATGLPTSGINPATGQPYPSSTLDTIHNVFDATNLRTFLALEDFISIDKFVGMNLPLDNQPIQIGIALENIRHSIEYVAFKTTMLPETTHSLAPGYEPIIGANIGIGMTPTEGLLQRLNFSTMLTVDDVVVPAPTDASPLLTLITILDILWARTLTSIALPTIADTSVTAHQNDLTISFFDPIIGVWYRPSALAGFFLSHNNLSGTNPTNTNDLEIKFFTAPPPDAVMSHLILGTI